MELNGSEQSLILGCVSEWGQAVGSFGWGTALQAGRSRFLFPMV